jgi:hypothetical protein
MSLAGIAASLWLNFTSFMDGSEVLTFVSGRGWIGC